MAELTIQGLNPLFVLVLAFPVTHLSSSAHEFGHLLLGRAAEIHPRTSQDEDRDDAVDVPSPAQRPMRV